MGSEYLHGFSSSHGVKETDQKAWACEEDTFLTRQRCARKVPSHEEICFTRRHPIRFVDRFRPALSRAKKRLQPRQRSQHTPARRYAGARRGAIQAADRRRAVVGADPHPGARGRRPAASRYGQSGGLFSAHGRNHSASEPENQPRHSAEFFRGYCEGLQRFVQDKNSAKKIIQKYTRDTAEDIIEATYQYAVDYVVRPPYPNREGIVETLKLNPNTEAKKANPDQFLDSSIVRTLEDEGFLRQIGMQK